MNDEEKTKEQLINELKELRQERSKFQKLAAENTQIEQRLKHSEEKWRLLTQTTPVFIMTIDHEGIIQYLNRTTGGVTIEQVIGTSIFDYVEPEQANILKNSVDKVFKTGEFDSYEILGFGQKGPNSTWYESHLGPVIDNTGKVVAVTILSINVTSRKQMEEKIRYNYKQQELLSSISQFFNYYQDFDDVMNKTLTMLGNHTKVSRVYIFEDIERRFCKNTFEWCNRGIQPEIANLQAVPYEETSYINSVLLKDKIILSSNIKDLPKKFYNHLQIQGIKSLLALPIFVQDNLFGFIGFDECVVNRIWNDSEIELLRIVSNIISGAYERKKHEDKLKQYQFMVESANDAIFFKDLQSRYIIANKKTLEAFGLSLEQVIDRNDYEIMSDKENAEKNIRDDQVVFNSGKPKEITKHMTGNDGKEYWFQAIKVPQFDEKGKMRGLVGIARDVTKHIEMENELRMSQKMAAIGTLAGGIAHEFNNLLFMITGNMGLLKQKINAPVYKECTRYFDSIRGATERAVNMVRQILTFSQKSDKKIEDVDLVRIIREGLKMMRASVPSTIEIVESVSLSNGIVSADSTQILQILINLCTNAKYVLQNTGGTIEVSLCREIKKHQSYLKLSVSDNGSGMSPEVKQRAFEPFFTTKPVGEGSGMGLSVVHGIVEDCGGNIEIVSVEGKGTTVHVFLPDHVESKPEKEVTLS